MWMKWETSKDKIEIFLWQTYCSKIVFIVVVVFKEKKNPRHNQKKIDLTISNY